MKHRKTHFGAHFSHGWRGLRDSRKDQGTGHPRRHRCPHHSQDTSVIKQQKERAFELLREARPAPTILWIFRDLGAGAAPAFLQIQLTPIGNRQCFHSRVFESDATVKR